MIDTADLPTAWRVRVLVDAAEPGRNCPRSIYPIWDGGGVSAHERNPTKAAPHERW